MKILTNNLTECNRYWQDELDWVGHSYGGSAKCTQTVHSSTEVLQVLLVAGSAILFSARSLAWSFHSLCSSCTASLPQNHKIKQLEEAGIILHEVWVIWPALFWWVPKKQDCMETNKSQASWNFNLWLYIYYRKLNSHIQTACQIKADGSLSKVIFNYPLPTINSILAHFNGCKYFSTINLRSGYYHIKLSKEAVEKTAVIIIDHS